MNKDHLTKLEEYLNQFNVPFKKEKLSTGEISYSFSNLSTGFANIIVLLNNNTPIGLSIRGLQKKMNELAHLADRTNLLLEIPISHYLIMDRYSITSQIVAAIKN